MSDTICDWPTGDCQNHAERAQARRWRLMRALLTGELENLKVDDSGIADTIDGAEPEEIDALIDQLIPRVEAALGRTL